MPRFLLSLFLLLSACSAWSVSILPLPEGEFLLQLDDHLDMLEDPDGRLTLEDVTGSARDGFAPASTSRLRIGFTRSTHWVRLALYNPDDTPRDVILQIHPTRLSGITLYDGSTPVEPLLRAPTTYHLVMPAQGRRLVHLRLQSDVLLSPEIRLYSEYRYIQENARSEWLLGASVATGITLLLAMLVCAAVLREPTYLYLAINTTAFVVFQGMVWGQASLWMEATLLGQASVYVLATFLAASSDLLLTRDLLQGGQYEQRRRQVLHQLLGLSVGVAVLGLLLPLHEALMLIGITLLATSLIATLCTLWRVLELGQAWLYAYTALRFLWLLLATAATLMMVVEHTGVEPARDALMMLFNLMFVLLLAVLLVHSLMRRDARAREASFVAVADAAARTRGEVLTKVSHELRTPISGVLGMTELLLDTPLTPHQRDCMTTLRQSGQAALDHLNDIVDFSSLQAGRITLQRVPLDLPALAAESVEMFHARADDKQLEIISHLHPDVPERVSGDPLRLRQILLHLLDNAIAFTEQGEVVLTISRDADHGPDMLLFTISDTGSSFSREHQRQLLTGVPAFDLPGADLGLSITRQLVEIMGGTIGMDSEPMRGCRVWFRIPLPAQPSDTAAERAIDATLHGLRLLVVDDNDTSRKVILQQASAWGLQVSGAHSGAEALAMLRASANVGDIHDIVIIDQHMPGMTGLQLANRLREESFPHEHMLLVMLTGAQHMPATRLLREAGIRRVLTKPVSGQALRITLAEEINALRSPEPPVAVTPADIQRDFSHLRVLVAEDNPVNAKVIETLLTRQGIAVRLVHNGQQALDAMQLGSYDLILMDCEMPVMDGMEATRRIRAWEQEVQRPRTPILALTAHALDEHRENSLRVGMDDHLSKPISRSALLDALTQWTATRPGTQAATAP